jgi:hypothetical protein
MKINIELDVDSADERIFRKSLMYFLWNNPATLSVTTISFDDKEIDFNEDRKEYSISINMSLSRVEEFKKLIMES